MTSTPPKVYNYDKETGEYIGESLADPDPLDKGNWLVPGHSCLDAPMASKKGYAICRNDSGWSHVADNRGIVYSIETGDKYLLSVLGEIPEGFTDKAPPGPFHKWTGKSWKIDKDSEQSSLTADALSNKNKLLLEASSRISPLQYAVDIGDVTESERYLLDQLKRYSVALNRIDLQEGFPKNITWPKSPE